MKFKKIKTLEDVVNNCSEFYNNSKKYCYWYGGKYEKCTQALLNRLSKQYPNIYTQSYINKCRKDIQNNLICIDCSGLVCKCLSIPNIGTEQFASHLAEYKPTIYNLPEGIVCYRKGHCGIIYHGKVLQARGVDYDIVLTKYNRSDWTKYYYLPSLYSEMTNKGSTADKFGVVVKQVIAGRYGNGDTRTAKLKQEGYSEKSISQIQGAVNYVYKMVDMSRQENLTKRIENMIGLYYWTYVYPENQK